MLLPYWVVVLAICCGPIVIAQQVQSNGQTKVNEETQTLNEDFLSDEETQINEAWMSPPGSQMYVRRNVDPATEDESPNVRAMKQDNMKNIKMINGTKLQKGPPYTLNRSGYGYGGGYGARYGGGYSRPAPQPSYPPIPGPGPNYGGGYGGGTIVGPVAATDLLLAGLFFQEKCLGQADLVSGYIPLFTFSKANVCARAFKSLTPVGCIQTVTSKNLAMVSVNQVKPLITFIEIKGNQVIVVVVAFVFEGSAQGKYVAIRALFDFPQLFRFCSGLLGNNLSSVDAIMVIADPPTMEIIEAHASPNVAFDKLRGKKLLECSGAVFLS